MKKSISILMILTVLFLTSCGASFNSVGIKFGNLLNDSEITSQDGHDYIIEKDGIYKDGKLILKGDYASINAVGEKLYFYDKSIRTICKSNTEGFKVERIAEIYTDNFVVQKDNIFASILVGNGSEDLSSPSNYNVVRMKVTDRKVTSHTPQLMYEKGKMIGAYGDRLYIETEKDDKIELVSLSLKADDERVVGSFEKGSKIIINNDNIYVMEQKDGKFGIYKMELYKENKELLVELSALNDKISTFNVIDNSVYFEDSVENEEGIKHSINKYDIKSKNIDEVISFDKRKEIKIGIGSEQVYTKVRDYQDLDTIPSWEKVEVKK